jgi:hypothetical protein
MRHPEKIYFEKLKEEICLRYRHKNPEAQEKIEEWNGKTIEGFQTDLQQEVKSAISVRWFYTHIKSGYEDKIPRTDVLDLLCRYVGYNGWNEFVAKKKEQGIVNEEAQPTLNADIQDKPSEGSKNYKKYVPFIMAVLVILLVSVIWAMNMNKNEILCRFCFSDADVGTQITKSKIEVQLLREKESPQTFTCNDSGCISLACKPGKITFITHAEYYQPDTIIRTITGTFQPETIRLKPDDYAMMISIFSRSKVEDWERRRTQLQAMFTDDVRIFQVYPGDQRGMEMYNKDEFIDKLTMPLASLNNIEVIQTVYNNGKISALRFIQKEVKN